MKGSALRRGDRVVVLVTNYHTTPAAPALAEVRVERTYALNFTWDNPQYSGASLYGNEGTRWCRAGDPVAARALLAAAALMDELP